MRLRLPISMESVSFSDDLQRCVGWSTALAAPRPATSVTLLLAILEAGAGTTAQRLLLDAGVTTQALEPFELATRGPEPGRAKGLRRLVRLPLGVRHSADMERVLRRAAEQGFVQKRRLLTADDLLLALVMEDGPAKDTLVSLGVDPGGLRSALMQARVPPDPPEDPDRSG
jgi:hypothetical protein